MEWIGALSGVGDSWTNAHSRASFNTSRSLTWVDFNVDNLKHNPRMKYCITSLLNLLTKWILNNFIYSKYILYFYSEFNSA